MTPTAHGPLFSLAAHGKLDDALVYKMRGNSPRVTIYRSHRDAQSQSQLDQRAHFLDGARLWSLMTDADRLAWTQQHQLSDRSGYNTFLQTVYMRETADSQWQHPKFVGTDVALPNFLAILTMENYANGTFRDISGHARHWGPTNATQEQGDRAQAVNLATASGAFEISDSNKLGNLSALTIGLRVYSDTPQASLPASIRLPGAYGYAGHAGFMFVLTSTVTLFRVGDTVADYDLNSTDFYTPGRWNNYIATFDANDSGRMTIIMNNRVTATQTSAATKIANLNTELTLGASSGGTPFPGLIDNVTLYKSASTAIRI